MPENAVTQYDLSIFFDQLRARARELIKDSAGALSRQIMHPDLGLVTRGEVAYARSRSLGAWDTYRRY